MEYTGAEREFGNFQMNPNDEVPTEISNSDEELLNSFDPTVPELKKMEKEVKKPAYSELPQPETPVEDIKNRRFKNVTEEQLKNYHDSHQSSSTKKNTVWGMKIFQDWNMETYGEYLDTYIVSAVSLGEILMKFYCEAVPQKKAGGNASTDVYHKNSLINIRGAINRHLQDINRNIDIVRDKEFKMANRALDGLLKERMRSGTSLPTNHKEIIEPADLQKMFTYLKKGSSSPVILRHAVWFLTSIHFLSRGLELHHQLNLKSFEFKNDENGEYVTLSHDTQQKNFQGGIRSAEAPSDKRMYADDTECCPVKMLKLLLEKTPSDATSLFNQYDKAALANSERAVWFTSKPLSKRTFQNFLPEICKNAGVEKRYTPHCIRATTIQHLNDSGWEARHIMFLSGHRNESSLRSYSRTVSTSQKRALSTTLSSLKTQTSSATMCDAQHAVVPRPAIQNELIPVETTTATSVSSQMSYQLSMQSVTQTPGFFASSTFTNCNFHFK